MMLRIKINGLCCCIHVPNRQLAFLMSCKWRYLAVNKTAGISPAIVCACLWSPSPKSKGKFQWHLYFSLNIIFFSRVKSGQCSSTHASCWKEHVEQWSRHAHTGQIQTAAKHTYHNSNLCYRYVHISICRSSWHGPAALALCSIQHLSILKECLWWASLTCIVCGREFRPSEPGLGPHQHTKHRCCCCD